MKPPIHEQKELKQRNRLWTVSSKRKKTTQKHTTSQQRRYNVAATSQRCSEVVTTLSGRCMFAGYWKCLNQFYSRETSTSILMQLKITNTCLIRIAALYLIYETAPWNTYNYKHCDETKQSPMAIGSQNTSSNRTTFTLLHRDLLTHFFRSWNGVEIVSADSWA